MHILRRGLIPQSISEVQGIFVVGRTHMNVGSHAQCPSLFIIQLTKENIKMNIITIEVRMITGIEIPFFNFLTLIIINIKLETINNNPNRNKLMNKSFVVIDNINPIINRKIAIIHNFIFIFKIYLF